MFRAAEFGKLWALSLKIKRPHYFHPDPNFHPDPTAEAQVHLEIEPELLWFDAAPLLNLNDHDFVHTDEQVAGARKIPFETE